jgi:iron-sulfur cluster assembly protein
MIKVSDTASKKIISMMQEDGFDAAKDYVRVGVKSGGCSGLSYELKFDNQIGENDKVFEDNNVKIAVEKKSHSLFSRNNFRIFRWFKRKRICF